MAHESKTLTERAIELLKRAILRGDLPPGERLHIEDLSERYAIGVTPIREALSRLASIGLVVAIGQRGFRTAAASAEDFEDVVCTRTLIETEALRLSVRKGGEIWKQGIGHALQQMNSRIHDLPELFDEGDEQFDLLHKQFHLVLISACGSQRMIQYCSDLYDEAYRHRRIFMAQARTRRDFRSEHEHLAAHILSGSEDRAAAYLTLHLSAPLATLNRTRSSAASSI
jgi:GntR family carbon starvation induced transcriptional regulator